MKTKFDPNDWEEIVSYLKEWDEWRRKRSVGRPDYTTDSIFIVPHVIALIKAQERLEYLTWVLIILTLILAFIEIKTILNF